MLYISNCILIKWRKLKLGNRIFSVTTYHIPGEKAKIAAEEWKRLGICAIGWSEVDCCSCKDKEEVIQRLKRKDYKSRDASRAAEEIWNFLKISDGDLVLAYSRDNTIAYVGEANGICRDERENSIGDSNGEFDYSHQIKVEWWDEPHHFNRHDLPEGFADQFGKRGKTVAEIDPGSKGYAGFIQIVKSCADSGSKTPGLSEDMVKAGLVKNLHYRIDRLEEGLVIKSAEIAIGKPKKTIPDFMAKDIEGKDVLIECKGSAGESAIEQIKGYEKEYGKKDVRLMIVAFRISNTCRKMARDAGNIELFECDLSFHKIQ